MPNLRRYKRPDFRLAFGGFLKFASARVATPLPAPHRPGNKSGFEHRSLGTEDGGRCAVAKLGPGPRYYSESDCPSRQRAGPRSPGRERCERNLSPFGSSRCCAVQCHSVDDPPLSGKVPVRCFFASCTRVVFNRLESYRQNCSAEDRWCVP